RRDDVFAGFESAGDNAACRIGSPGDFDDCVDIRIIDGASDVAVDKTVGQVDVAVALRIADHDVSQLDWAAGACGETGRLFGQQLRHAGAHRAEADLGDLEGPHRHRSH